MSDPWDPYRLMKDEDGLVRGEDAVVAAQAVLNAQVELGLEDDRWKVIAFRQPRLVVFLPYAHVHNQECNRA